MEKNIEINLYDFLIYVDMLNSGADRSCVFAYLEDYLKEEKGIKLNLEEYISDEDE